MDYRHLYEYALFITICSHAGQVDKLGRPYSSHPIRVMRMIKTDSYIIKSIALLHDFYEDCDTKKYDVSCFPDIVFEKLDLLTHKKGMTYKDYIKRLSRDKIVTKIKIADLMDNTNPKRLDELYKKHPKTALRLAKKYVWALQYLMEKDKRRDK